MHKILSLLILITLIGAFFRLWQLGSIPNGLNRDEAALGYNAYLLLETGTDEWGQSWPLTLKSFGDYKLAGAVWSMIPFIAVLGLSDWAVRLPIVLAGIALIPIGFGLAKVFKLSNQSSLFVALTISVAPVYIFFSRFGFEAILALSFFAGGLLLLLHDFKKNTRLLFDLLGLVLFAYSFITYNTTIFLVPLVILFLLLQRGFRFWKKWLPASAMLMVIALGVSFLLLPASQSKGTVTIFSDPTLIMEYPNFRAQFAGPLQDVLGNKYAYYVFLIFPRIVAFFSPSFLVQLGGTHPWHQLPGWSHLTYPLYGVVVISILWAVLYALVKSLAHRRKWKQVFFTQSSLLQHPVVKPLVVLVAIAYSLLLPSITVDAPHATRSLIVFLWLFLLCGVFLDWIITQLPAKKQQQWLIPLFSLLLLVSTTQYFYSYLMQYPAQSVVITQSGLSQILEINSSTEPIYVVDPEGYQYSILAWQQKIPASVFSETIQHSLPNPIGLVRGTSVGRFRFVESQEAVPNGQPLYIFTETGWEKVK